VAVAISTDPRDDTHESIRAFLQRHRALGTFRYLTAPLSEMKRLWQSFQILSSFESGNADTHSAPVRIYGRDGLWLATQHVGADLTPRNLAHDVRVALGEGTSESAYGLSRQPRARRTLAAENAAAAATPATRSESQSADSWRPVDPARVASTR
jgi:hypothetical protein